MALHMHTYAAGAGKVACSKRHVCRPSQLPRKQNRRLVVVASSGQRSKAVTSAVATTEAPTQQQQQQLEQRIASVSVNLGTAVEQVNVPLSDPNSRLVQAEINFPLGLVIERECLQRAWCLWACAGAAMMLCTAVAYAHCTSSSSKKSAACMSVHLEPAE